MFRRWYSGLSLRAKAVGLTMALTTISLGIVASTGIWQIREQIAQEQHRAVDSLAMGIAQASRGAVLAGDTNELSHLAAGFVKDENILFVAVYGEGPQPIASAVSDQAAFRSFLAGDRREERSVIGERSIYATDESDSTIETETDSRRAKRPPSPPQARQVIGRVVVGLSNAPALLAQSNQSQLTATVTILTEAMGSIVLFMTLGTWMRRLQRLAEASESISRGDFGGSIADNHEDEIGRLAKAFDSMRLTLRQRDVKLQKFTDILQEKVKERTTALELALATAEEANRAKSLFLANMSHELRTPLNGVIGMVDLLLATGPSGQQRRYCEVAKSSARSLLDLINDILDFSKIEAGKFEIDSIDFNLHEVVEGVTQMLGERAAQKKIELLCSVARDVPAIVSGDSVRLRQVLLNLMSNAVKFTDKGDVVVTATLESRLESYSVVKFTVKDSGIGIPQDRINRLFKSFSQVDASTTRKFGGTGLGLAISQRIVGLMGGQIGVTSEEGRGSTFWFTASLGNRVQPRTTSSDSTVDPRGLRALAVDDNFTNREILQAQLASWHLRADVADSAAQAMDMLGKAAAEGEPYRVAILDMHMPQADGAELARRIKADPHTRNLILISLSSISDQLRPDQMSDLGFSACLTKPALPSQLYNAIVDSLAADERPARIAPAAAALPVPEMPLTDLRVLLAEDNEVNRLVASEILRHAGCVCTMVVNGREAMDEALKNPYDVILMDCQMPEMDGFEATRLIRQAESASKDNLHRPIIALTANAIKGDRENCLAAGMDEYVTKPIEPAELFRAIRTVMPKVARVPASPASVRKAMSPAPDTMVESTGASPVPPVDVESLRERCMGSSEIAAKVLTTFGATSPGDIETLVEYVKKGDAKAAANAAHKIKGSAANISAEGIRRVASEIEKLARADALSQTEECLGRLKNEMEVLRGYLGIALDKLGATASTPNSFAGRQSASPASAAVPRLPV